MAACMRFTRRVSLSFHLIQVCHIRLLLGMEIFRGQQRYACYLLDGPGLAGLSVQRPVHLSRFAHAFLRGKDTTSSAFQMCVPTTHAVA